MVTAVLELPRGTGTPRGDVSPSDVNLLGVFRAAARVIATGTLGIVLAHFGGPLVNGAPQTNLAFAVVNLVRGRLAARDGRGSTDEPVGHIPDALSDYERQNIDDALRFDDSSIVRSVQPIYAHPSGWGTDGWAEFVDSNFEVIEQWTRDGSKGQVLISHEVASIELPHDVTYLRSLDYNQFHQLVVETLQASDAYDGNIQYAVYLSGAVNASACGTATQDATITRVPDEQYGPFCSVLPNETGGVVGAIGNTRRCTPGPPTSHEPPITTPTTRLTWTTHSARSTAGDRRVWNCAWTKAPGTFTGTGTRAVLTPS